MKLLLVTYGTEGDTRPQVMLARGLIDAGHQVSLLAEQQTLGTARELGVPHAALPGPSKARSTPWSVRATIFALPAGAWHGWPNASPMPG